MRGVGLGVGEHVSEAPVTRNGKVGLHSLVMESCVPHRVY